VTDRQRLSVEDQRRDALIFGLRLLNGVPNSLLADEPGHRKILAKLLAKGLIIEDGSRTRLTPLGRRFADSVASDLF
jgi:oxygen-independent coproporphyrinogen-3 oxidase